MKLITKFLIAFISLLVLTPLAGYISIETGYQNELKRTAAALDAAAEKIAASSTPLSTALVATDDSDLAITVSFVDNGGSISTFVDGNFAIESAPTLKEMQAASKAALTFEDEPPHQLRSVALGDNEFVLLEISIEVAHHGRANDLLTLMIFSVVSIVVGGSAVTILVRRDVRKAISSLRGTADQERETRESMQTFMGDASHELRTPLTVIKGYAELLAQSGVKTPADQREKAYARIIEQVNRMDDTISSLLELAEVGSVSSNSFGDVNLTALAIDAADDLRALSPKRPVETSIAPVTVRGSHELLARLLANAIGNINRHTGKTDPVRITLSKDRKHAHLVIEDGGLGLPAAAYERGIQGFRRFDESRSRETGGTGLGMTIMNSIAAAHDGELSIAPSELGGLKLDIKLPLN